MVRSNKITLVPFHLPSFPTVASYYPALFLIVGAPLISFNSSRYRLGREDKHVKMSLLLESGEEEDVSHQNKKPRLLVSLVSVLFTQFAISLLPLILPDSSLLLLLPLSGLLLVTVVGLGRFCKTVAGVRASAPAFVFFSILFIWALYLFLVRQVISSLADIMINFEIIMVIIGLYRIMSLDPGFVKIPTSEIEGQGEYIKISTSIVRHESPVEEVFTGHRKAVHCKHCKHYVLGFDHHCPAFGNCIGQRNHVLFIVLLVGFVVSEASFAACAFQFTAKSNNSSEFETKGTTSRNLVVGAMLFCLVQVHWQVVFIMWHVYCACFNIKTDEWINWKKYPEFQINKVDPLAARTETGTQFTNPYDKGILRNLKEFLTRKG